MSSIFIERLNGTIYDLDNLGFVVQTFDPPSTNYNHTIQQIGLQGETLVGTTVGSLTIPLSLIIKANSVNDLELQRLKLKNIFDSSEMFYVYSDRIPYLRWKVVAESFSFPQTSNFWQATATINLICPDGYAESQGTTLNPSNYGWGMNVPSQRLDYIFDNQTNINVYNAGNIDLKADEHPVKIIFNGDVSQKLTIKNKTTNQTFEYNRSLSKDKTLIIDGLIPIENDSQMYYASNHAYIDFKRGWNNLQIEGATNFTIKFDTKFYY